MDIALAAKRVRALDALHGVDISKIEEAYSIVAKALSIDMDEAEEIVESAIEAEELQIDFILAH